MSTQINVKCVENGTTKEMAAMFGPKLKAKMAAVEKEYDKVWCKLNDKSKCQRLLE